MKNAISTLLIVLTMCGAFLQTGCGNQADNSAVEADSLQTDTSVESYSKANILVLQPNVLEIALPEGINEISRKKGASEDSIFFEVAMGIQVMDLDFFLHKQTNDSLSIEQMEEQRLYINDEGKTFDYDSSKIYRSKWYTMPFFTEKKFSLTTYKDEDDYGNQLDFSETRGIKGLSENQTISASTNRYYIRLIQPDKGVLQQFILVLELTVGC